VAARIAKLVLWVHLGPLFWEEEFVGVSESDGTIRKTDGGFV